MILIHLLLPVIVLKLVWYKTIFDVITFICLLKRFRTCSAKSYGVGVWLWMDLRQSTDWRVTVNPRVNGGE